MKRFHVSFFPLAKEEDRMRTATHSAFSVIAVGLSIAACNAVPQDDQGSPRPGIEITTAAATGKRCIPCFDENGVDQCCGGSGGDEDPPVAVCKEYDLREHFWRNMGKCSKPRFAGQRCGEQCLEDHGCQVFDRNADLTESVPCPMPPVFDKCPQSQFDVCIGVVEGCTAVCGAAADLGCAAACLGSIGLINCVGCL